MHLKEKCSSSDASQFLKTDLEVVHRAWGSIRRRFRRRGIRTPRQLIVNPRVYITSCLASAGTHEQEPILVGTTQEGPKNSGHEEAISLP